MLVRLGYGNTLILSNTTGLYEQPSLRKSLGMPRSILCMTLSSTTNYSILSTKNESFNLNAKKALTCYSEGPTCHMEELFPWADKNR